jgi:hypothetical protein
MHPQEMTVFRPSDTLEKPNELTLENAKLREEISSLREQTQRLSNSRVNETQIVKECFEEAYESVCSENRKLR